MSILTVQHLEKHFENTKVLNDISFSLEEGQALSIIGSSGSGKTTLLRCLNFLETPDAGTITVQDKVLFDADHHANCSEKEIRKNRLHFGMVFQSFNLFPQYTALENVTLARELMAKDSGESKEAIRAAGMELLDQMGLADRAGHYPHQLSGGQQQRVAIARALALHPDILCFDTKGDIFGTHQSIIPFCQLIVKHLGKLHTQFIKLVLLWIDMDNLFILRHIAVLIDKGKLKMNRTVKII